MSSTKPIIDIIAVAFEKLGELKVFVQSWLNQTEKNWKLTVIHDGQNELTMENAPSRHNYLR